MLYILILIVVLALVLMNYYNSFSRLKVQIEASLQEIGNQLKRQSNLIPNLVDSVKGFMKHEKGIFDELTSARKMVDKAISSNDPKMIDNAQAGIDKVLSSLRVIVESNPQIQSSGLVNNLMDELRDTADKLMYSRRTLIDLTASYNTMLVTIPSAWVGKIFGFTPEQGLTMSNDSSVTQVSQEETKSPKVSL